MDPNMMNQNYQMGGDPQMMNYQEQTQAQVLNYNDVEMTAEAENKTKSTKKAALFFALIGIILIAGGVFYKFNPLEEETTTPTSETKNIEDTTTPVEDQSGQTPTEQTPAAQTASTTTTCTLTDNSGTDGTTRQTVYSLVFDSNVTLMSYVKKYTVTALQGAQRTAGMAKVQEENTAFTNLSTSLSSAHLNGYSMEVHPTQEGTSVSALTITINVNFATLDVSKIPTNVTQNPITKVDLTKGQAQVDVKQVLSSYGYTCQ